MAADLRADGKLIAVDWGTSRLRAWLLDAVGRPLAEAASDDGIGKVASGGHAAAFAAIAADWPPVPALMAGMVGSRQGWREAEYVPCPASAAAVATGLLRFDTADEREVAIVPGLSVTTGECDVMRGEETQILGLVAGRPSFDGTVVLPGTHAKWARVEDGSIIDFQSFMSGELFELLSKQSFLRHSVAASADGMELADSPAFAVALRRAIKEGLPFVAGLFPIRARQLLNNTAPADNLAYLSGLVIGGEIAAARTAGRLASGNIAIVGAASLARAYHAALAMAGARPEIFDGNELVLDGLVRIARSAGLIPDAPT